MEYSAVTETPGNRITIEALSMMYTRYAFAASFCVGKTVLEVGCGAGQGLGYLATRACRVVGGDFTESLLSTGRRHYGDSIPFVRLDAHRLPFRDGSFDVVILYEALYYLAEPRCFVEECQRVLRRGGVVLVCTVNKDWVDFNPSPFSFKYFSAPELKKLLDEKGFEVEFRGAFPTTKQMATDCAVSFMKRVAVRLHLIPKTMKGKEVLKRLFLGRLTPVPAEIVDGIADFNVPVSIRTDCPNAEYKVLYAIGRSINGGGSLS